MAYTQKKVSLCGGPQRQSRSCSQPAPWLRKMRPPAFSTAAWLPGTARRATANLRSRSAEGPVYLCSFDEKTYIERDDRRISMAGAEKGDRLEIVSDRRQGSTLCYARTVHILDAPRNLPGARRPAAPSHNAADVPATSQPDLQRRGVSRHARRAGSQIALRRAPDAASAPRHALSGRWPSLRRSQSADQHGGLRARRARSRMASWKPTR